MLQQNRSFDVSLAALQNRKKIISRFKKRHAKKHYWRTSRHLRDSQ